jgi:hypothetical protein
VHTVRTARATAGLVQEAVVFPSGHLGFVDGAGRPEAFAARLREVLDTEQRDGDGWFRWEALAAGSRQTGSGAEGITIRWSRVRDVRQRRLGSPAAVVGPSGLSAPRSEPRDRRM